MVLKSLSKNDVNLYKAISILLIIFHNFFHLVHPQPGENEFNLNADRVVNLFDYLISYPYEIINILFSYFGHYGVQVFIFLSAYGLTKKYLTAPPKYLSFIKERIFKIYPIIFFLIITIWFLRGLVKGDLFTLQYLYELFLKLTMLSNFIPDHALSIVGPWWFLSLIFQFYFIFPLLLKLYNRYGNISLFYISVLSLVFVYSMSFVMEYNFYYIFIPHIPEFAFGIYLAHKKNVYLPISIFLGILGIFILSNFYNLFWYFSNITALTSLLIIFQFIISLIKKNTIILVSFTFIGNLSMELFLVHGFLRQPYVNWTNQINNWFATLNFSLLFFIVSVIFAYLLYIFRVNILSKYILKVSKIR